MTVKITPTNIRADTVTKGYSRYRNQNVIYWGEQNRITFDTYIRKEYIKTGKERVMVISKAEEYRPDLVASDAYGVSDMWWKIMEVNNIHDIYDFKAGKTIILPDNIF